MNRSSKVTITSAFFLNLAGFAVFSFLAIYLASTLAFSSLETASVLSVLTISSRVLPLVTGGMGDRFGYKKLMGIGLLLRAAGFFLLAFSTSFSGVIMAVFLIGSGAACYEPSSFAYFSKEENPLVKKKLFLFLNFALNGGAILGPLLGGLLLVTDPRLPFFLSAAIFSLLYIIQLLLLQEKKSQEAVTTSFAHGLSLLFKNKPFLLFCTSMIFFWFMFAQLTVALPLHMFAISKQESLVSLVITLNAATGLLFMLCFRNVYVKVNSLLLLAIGFPLMAISLLFIGFVPNPYWLLAGVMIFTVGETLVLPSSDMAIAEFVEADCHGIFYGFSDISFAIGATIGNFTGVYLLNTFATSSFVPWFVFCLIGMCGFFLMLVVFREQMSTVTENDFQKTS